MNGQHDHDDHYYTKTEDDVLFGEKANTSSVYTKSEVDALIAGTVHPDPPDPPPLAPPPQTDVTVNPGDNIQTAVNDNPDGTSFLLKSGVHVRQQIQPKPGSSFVGELGTVLDGEDVTNYAFLAWSGSDTIDVTLRGLEIKNYAPQWDSHGAIMVKKSGWTIENCDVHHTPYAGIYIKDGATVRGNYLHHNGRVGLKPYGSDMFIENNEIAYNNFAKAFDPTWEAGGIKVAMNQTNQLIRNNNVHDNYGPGIWIDVNAVNIIIEDNLVENNDTNGIDYEISSYGVIRNNTVRNNGHKHPSLGWMWGAGITIRSPDVEVYGNTVEANYNGIGIIDTSRPGVVVDNVNIHDNTVTGSAHWQAGAVPGGKNPDQTLFDRNLTFANNTYDGGTFRWRNKDLTLVEWQALGFDL